VILAGDIGGTNTRLALFDGDLRRPVRLETFRSNEHWTLEQMVETPDPAARIGRAALSGRSPTCAQALDLFVSIYGAQAGNLALTLLATGGVYVGGGIAPKILPKLRQGAFMESFVEKGRFAPLLERIPVRVILNDKAALLGAARHAADGGLQ
jgi:glucokinase